MASVGGMSAALPLGVRAQQRGQVHRLAIVTLSESRRQAAVEQHWAALFGELSRLGYDEARNLVVQWHSLGGNRNQVSALAREVVEQKPSLIFTQDLPLMTALKAATTEIPIVIVAPDPIAMGLGAGLARPGSNITGFNIAPDNAIIAKRVELLKEAVPATSRLGWLSPRLGVGGPFLEVFRDAAARLGLHVIESLVPAPYDEAAYRQAFGTFSGSEAHALYVTPASENLMRRRLIADLAIRGRLPTMFVYRDHVEAGGLMAYAIDLADLFRRAAVYVDQILKGARPAEMPFQQPDRFVLVVNLRTARAIGLTIPPTVLARADEVIE
jgi:putative ABC transport system substrate-binding protein